MFDQNNNNNGFNGFNGFGNQQNGGPNWGFNQGGPNPNGPQPNGPQPQPKKKKEKKPKQPITFKFPTRTVVILLIGMFLLFGVLPQAMVITYPDEYNVVRQFGKIVDIKEEPGFSYKIPFITSLTSLPKKLMLYDLPASDVITSDKKTMIVDCYTLWEITDAKKFIQTLNGSVMTAENRIDTIVYNAMKNTISDMTQDEVIQSRDGKITIANNSSELENATPGVDVDTSELDNIEGENTNTVVEIKNLSEEIMDKLDDVEGQYGIVIHTVDVKILDLPDENKAAVYERMIAERNNIAAQYTALGASEAQIIRNAADKEVSILLSEANAKADRLIAQGEAEYMRILSEAYNDEEKADFYLFVRSLDALKVAMQGNNKTIILDESSPIAQIFQTVE